MIPRFTFSWPIWIIPIAVLVWGFAVYSFSIPFYDINPDPEYPYLINGMNVAIGNYSNIGHLDHPGTPFQFYCGFVIKVTHLFTGEGTIASDVLGNRPEYYLRAIQASLVILHALIAFFIGVAAKKRRVNPVFIIILQSAVILLPWLFLRVNQERWLMTCSMLLTLVYIAYGLRDRRPRRFAIWSGLIMAMALATKFNYLPILLLPLLLVDTVKNKLIYLGVLAGGYFLFILPVLENFHYHIDFITGIASHDGKYGGGEERMFNLEVMKDNFTLIFSENPEIPILITIPGMLLIGSLLDQQKRIFSRKALLYFGVLLVIAVQLLMVTKHYAPNYLIPLISVYPLLLFVLYSQTEDMTGRGKFSFLYQF
ncbi:MAG TPA: hypothetical protein VJ949_03555, partial [Cryomorphaceae bacterium]|nr:hypothetical protein [Cryomorphaceae bacterium]